VQPRRDQPAYSGVVITGKRVFAFTGRGCGSIAVTTGGSGDANKSHTTWTRTDTTDLALGVVST
jgi:hypothetical protein